jgi:drug/metabolite transporter (DMT)-like permease
MSGVMYRGIVLGLLSYGFFSFSDASVKAIGHGLSIYEIAFFAGILSLPMVLIVRPRGMSFIDMLKADRWWLIVARGLTGMTAGLLGTIAFQNLPFAEAYAILFLAPSFSTVWSIFFLKEEVNWLRWLAIAVGLIGVIAVVRPSFDTLTPAHFAALAAAFSSSLTIILLRKLNRTEKPTAILTYSMLVGVVLNGLFMLPSYRGPELHQFGLLAMVAFCSGIGQILMLSAVRRIPASRIVPTQYSQIAWALLIGGLFFGEFPDRIALVGIGLVVASGLINFVTGTPKPVSVPAVPSGGPAAISAGRAPVPARPVR